MPNHEPSVEALYATGHWLLAAERFVDAAIVFRTMALAAPSDERAWLALGSCHEAIGQQELATTLYGIAEAVAAPAIRCTIARGRVLRAFGSDDEAQLSFERARDLAVEIGNEELVSLAECELRMAS